MPQNAIAVQAFSGSNTQLDISTATVVKAAPGQLVTISVISAGTTVGTANDSLTTAGASIANQIAAIPNTAGSIQQINWKCSNGIVIVPGTGQVISVAYN